METGFRERQETQPVHREDHALRAATRLLPGRPDHQAGRSVAISNDPRTWPAVWPDKANGSGRSGMAGKLERLLRQATDRRPGKLHRHGRRLLRHVGLLSRLPGRHAPRSRPPRRGARLPVGQSAGRQRDLLALRHHERGDDRLHRQHHLRPLHGLRRRRLGILVRRHRRVGRRQRLLRPLTRA